MINNIGDIVKDKWGNVAMIVDIERMPAETYMFHLFFLAKEDLQKWLEPFEQELSPRYWETLA